MHGFLLLMSKLDQVTFPQSYCPIPTVPTRLFFPSSELTGEESNVFFCFCSPSPSRFDVMCVQRCSSACHSAIQLLSPSCQHDPVWAIFCDLSHNKPFSPTQLSLTSFCCCFSSHSLEAVVNENPKLLSVNV